MWGPVQYLQILKVFGFPNPHRFKDHAWQYQAVTLLSSVPFSCKEAGREGRMARDEDGERKRGEERRAVKKVFN
jgi:hypothetical protein